VPDLLTDDGFHSRDTSLRVYISADLGGLNSGLCDLKVD